MDFTNPNWALSILIMAPPLLMSLTIHEFAHARTALAFGDPTALQAGRVSLNPLRHLDPIGTLCMFFAFVGWAKPVPVDLSNLHPRGLGNFSVSLAGPASNLMLAILSATVLRIVIPNVPEYYLGQLCVQSAVLLMLVLLLVVNIGLCIFNLVPLFPLDGSHILQELLPFHLQHRYIMWQRRFGMYALGALIFLPRFAHIPSPVFYVVRWVNELFFMVFRFSPESRDAMARLLDLIGR